MGGVAGAGGDGCAGWAEVYVGGEVAVGGRDGHVAVVVGAGAGGVGGVVVAGAGEVAVPLRACTVPVVRVRQLGRSAGRHRGEAGLTQVCPHGRAGVRVWERWS